MDIIEVHPGNIDEAHICCAISASAEARRCAAAKKGWMRAVYPDGYRFYRLDAQGKALIETIPGENAWSPIMAEGWLFIDCFWVSGKFKGQGHANALFEKALEQAKAESRHGLVALGARQKQAFLSDSGFYRHKGFLVADTAPPYYELLALPLAGGAPLPRFGPSAKAPEVAGAGVVIYYSDHCPHTSKYVPVLEKVAAAAGVPFAAHKITTRQEAQAAPNPFPTFALFYNGAFVGNKILSEGKMRKLLESS